MVHCERTPKDDGDTIKCEGDCPERFDEEGTPLTGNCTLVEVHEEDKWKRECVCLYYKAGSRVGEKTCTKMKGNILCKEGAVCPPIYDSADPKKRKKKTGNCRTVRRFVGDGIKYECVCIYD
jgi:hypothetical protein